MIMMFFVKVIIPDVHHSYVIIMTKITNCLLNGLLKFWICKCSYKCIIQNPLTPCQASINFLLIFLFSFKVLLLLNEPIGACIDCLFIFFHATSKYMFKNVKLTINISNWYCCTLIIIKLCTNVGRTSTFTSRSKKLYICVCVT